MMHGPETSDPCIVAARPTNNAGMPAAEPVEPKEGAKGNMHQQRTRRAQDRASVSQVPARVGKAARRRKTERFSLHPVKTRLIQFGRRAAAARARRGLGKPEAFALLGFTFLCGRSMRGRFLLLRLTRRDRIGAKLKAVKQELRRRRHQPIPVQGAWLAQVVSGFFDHHAVPTNARALSAFRDRVVELWRRSLRRRSRPNFTT